MEDVWKAVNLATPIVTLLLAAIAKMGWGRVRDLEETMNHHRDMIEDRYTKNETKEVVNWSLEPLAKSAENLEKTSAHLLEIVKKLEIQLASIAAEKGRRD